MKRILFLGASATQYPAIKYARDQGYYVITTDYLPDNPGHALAHEKNIISTTDKEAVLALAAASQIDGIVAYASEPAAPTAAFVAQRLGLPSNSPETVELLTSKDHYRTFLARNGFACPKNRGCVSMEEARVCAGGLKLPAVVKPVDSSGSRGVTVLRDWANLEPAYVHALSFSRAKRVIVEEFVGKMGEQIIGEGFVWDGKLIVSCFGRHRFNPRINGLVPIGGDFPFGDEELSCRLRSELQRFITQVGLRMGPMNIEFRLGDNGELYLMEVAPRNGGNMLPQLATHATGFDMVKYTVDVALGLACAVPTTPGMSGFYSYCVLHSTCDGRLGDLSFSPRLRTKIVEQAVWTKPGDEVFAFTGANRSLGILILSFTTAAEMHDIMDNLDDHVHLRITPEQDGQSIDGRSKSH